MQLFACLYHASAFFVGAALQDALAASAVRFARGAATRGEQGLKRARSAAQTIS